MVVMPPKIVVPRYRNAAYALWSTEATLKLDASWKALAWRVPDHIVQMIPARIRELLGCIDTPLVVIRNFNFVDICSGRARITKWAMSTGLLGVAIDKDYGDHMNIGSDEGFALAVLCVLRLVQGGLAFFACQCSSWVWMSRHSTKRSMSNPTGNCQAPSVIAGNLLNNRCALLSILCHLAGSVWVVEQPGSSLFFDTSDMKGVIAYCKAVFCKFKMNIFRHPTDKDTLLVGTAAWVQQVPDCGRASHTSASATSSAPAQPVKAARRLGSKIKRKVQPNRKAQPKRNAVALARCEVKADGTKAVTGNKQALKDSQVYPVRFALSVVRLHWPEKFGR